MTMCLKVLNMVNFRALIQTLIISYYYWLTPFAKLLDLLAINHSLSERRIIFVPQLLKFMYLSYIDR